MQRLLLSLLILLFAIPVESQELELYEKQLFIQGNDTLRCRILTPINFTSGKKYPLVVFLHGAGERGNNNESQLLWGGKLFLDSTNRVKFPAIVVFPQCPADSTWSNLSRTNAVDSLGGFALHADRPMRKPMALVLDFIDTLVKNGSVDKERIYIGGLSLGGFGTFEILWRRPELFAAAFPICGGGIPAQVKLYADKLPIWVFHGDKDPVVPVSNSRLMVNALTQHRARVKYSEYPGVAHDSWNNAFAEPELLPWLFAQKKK
jgi:predicted peptidase